VLFRVRSYKDYGALSGRSVDDMIAGARVEVAPFKEDPMDFVLWKPSSEEEPGWTSPWGRGRPGWHIECSAMSYELLGASFDIHGGGLDLQFPHHENEVAQSCCAHPEASFARYWMHNEMLQVEGKKMSKSLGNFFTVRDLLDQGVPGEVIRFVYLSTHYRSPMDWTAEKAAEARHTLKSWRGITNGAFGHDRVDQQVIECVSDDMNTPGAISRLHEIAKLGDAELLKSSAQFLGLLNEAYDDWAQQPDFSPLKELLDARREARTNRNFRKSDEIRDFLKSFGVVVKDHSDGTCSAEIEGVQAYDYFNALTFPERRIFLGTSYGDDWQVSTVNLLSAYVRRVSELAKDLLE
jgi:cysteinyl-tRNA synthetase